MTPCEDKCMADDQDNKAKAATEGNAPGGPDFSSNQSGPLASGDGAVLGAQVDPSTQTREDDPRVLAKPVTDPGPTTGLKYHDPRKGETISDVNEPLTIARMTGTGGGTEHMTVSAELAGHGGASDVYNPEKGEGLTDMAIKRNETETRELAPALDTETGKTI